MDNIQQKRKDKEDYMLRRFCKKFRYGEKGFTLIELLVVVAILGVLAAVAIPNVTKFMGKGKTEAQNTEQATLQTAMVAMISDTNASPGGVHAVSTATADMHAFYISSNNTVTLDKYLDPSSMTITGTYPDSVTSALLKSGRTYKSDSNGTLTYVP
jgi:type IV pilus assembly protein PilA